MYVYMAVYLCSYVRGKLLKFCAFPTDPTTKALPDRLGFVLGSRAAGALLYTYTLSPIARLVLRS